LKNKENILVTGGLGYIGSHTVLCLLKKKFNVVVIDNLSNSSISTVENLKLLSNCDFEYHIGDYSDLTILEDIFIKNNIHHVIHFAAKKSISESIAYPENYYENNVYKLDRLIKFIFPLKIKSFIFSSSASVYSDSNKFPVNEKGVIGYKNPYTHTKILGEDMLKEYVKLFNNISIGILRYFNPIGCHKSGIIGDFPMKSSTNIIPMIYKSMIHGENFKIYGSKYPTKDGTAVRDYIHVSDLANAHLKLLQYLNCRSNSIINIFNIGTGEGSTVLDLLNCYNSVNKTEIKHEFVENREGDLAICYAKNDNAMKYLNWKSKNDLIKMCKDAHKFLLQNFDKIKL
jgi:UDP-glucose 4-epimerase